MSGRYDDAFRQNRLRVGAARHRVGLEPQWFQGAFNPCTPFRIPCSTKTSESESPTPAPSPLKPAMRDVELPSEARVAASTVELRARNRELESALQICFDAEVRAQRLAKLAGHEIRGALNAIGNSCAELAEDYADRVPDDAQKSMELARDRCWQLMEVVEQILAEPERAGRAEWVDVAVLLRDVQQRLRLHTGDNNVELRMLDKPVHVWACAVELREVFANLVANAVRHLDKPDGLIEVEHRREGDCDRFCVVDNGVGIAREVQSEIFAPFFHGPDVVDGTGKGLGLFFVRTIVERHGGKVWVESTPGCGSRFSFTIPVNPDREGRDPKETVVRTASPCQSEFARGRGQGGGRRFGGAGKGNGV